MKTKRASLTLHSPPLASIAVTFLATLMALPVQAALTVPQVPPKSGNGVVPNVLFILDDSGSMAFETMASSTVPSISSPNITNQSYISNTVYYNPARTYQPWTTAAGGIMTGGASYSAAFASFNHASGSTINLADAASCASVDRNGSATNVCGGVQTFYVPMNTTNTSAAYLSVGSNYYRYRILTSGSVERCTRISGNWTSCVNQTPTGRTPEAERLNYATWFSYHRTRIKVAKAGASSAFNGLVGDKYRVGFTTIWGPTGAGADNAEFLIPVGTDNGLFRGANRTTWFDRLFATRGYNGTPLLPALDRAGQYFSQTGSAGPNGGLTNQDGSQFACRQNFSILTTDGFWNSGTATVGNADGTAGPTISGPNGATYPNDAVRPFSDSRSNTLADVAMKYWKTDLRPDLENIVAVSAANPAFWQHMVTFGISIGLRGSLDPDTAVSAPGANNDLTDGGLSWPDPLDAEDEHRIDDLLHAAVNSRGEFVAASDPDSFSEGLRNALATITNRTSSSSNVASNSTSLGTDTRLFQASYIGGEWTGELRAFPVIPPVPADPNATPPTPAEAARIGSTPVWSASEEIPAWDARKIFTHSGSVGATFPTAAQLTTLEAGLGTGLELANYLKGDTSNERQNAGVFRDRLHLLGDIIHSSPVYVKDSNTIFVGANDGMLHAFDGTSGVEQFAYIPAGLNFTKLAELGDPDYPHHYFADGPITVSSKSQTPNKNILVASLGRGGKGLYALDVTTPGSFAVGDVEWDISGDPDMGHVLGEPFITRLNGGEGTGVIVANGFNSANDRAVLLVVDIDDGSIIKRIDAGSATSNGLFGPRGWDNDGNGTVDYVYASDLQGNVWKFDLSGNTGQWDVAYKQGSTPLPLFVATDAAGNRQAITGGISIAIDPKTYKQWVFFGTGRYLTSTDPADLAVQSMYGIIDDGSSIGTRAANDGPNDPNGLVSRTTVAAGIINGMPVRGFEASTDPLPVGKRGWFVDFAPPAPGTAPGERMVGKPAVVGPVLLFSSIIPSSDPCTPGGRGFINAINPFTGGSVGSHFFDVDGDGQYGDDEVGGVPVGSVDTGVGMNTDALLIEKLITVGGSGGNTGSVGVSNPAASGRVSWRELIRN